MGTNSRYAADAATAGLVLGLVSFVFVAIPAILNMGVVSSGYMTWIRVIVMIIAIYYFGKRRAVKKGDLGNTFGEAYGFAIVSMFYAGIIAGFGQYILSVYIAPEYFEARTMDTLALMQASFGADYVERVVNTGYLEFMNNPIVVTISGIIAMMLEGGVLALFISPFLKRSANVFAEDNNEE